MLPTVVSSWLDDLWVVDHSLYTQETVEREKPNSVDVLDTLKLVRLAPTSFVLPVHPLNKTNAQSVFQFSQGLKSIL